MGMGATIRPGELLGGLDLPRGRKRLRSLRWQISTLLLISALTAIALAALTTVLLTALAAGPTLSVLSEVGATSTALDDIQARMLVLEKPPDKKERLDVQRKFQYIGERLREMGKLADHAQWELTRYRGEVNSCLAMTAPPHGQQRKLHKQRLRLAHRRVQAALIATAYSSRPAWLDKVLPLIPWGMGWILIMAALSVWRAFLLRSQLSQPLHTLAAAAGEVRAGSFHKPMPEIAGVTEVTELRHSVEHMRERLVTSIASLDSRKEQLTTILDNMSDGVLLVDSQGRVRDYNHCVRTLWERGGEHGEAPAADRALRDVFPRFPAGLITSEEASSAEVEVDPDATPPRVFEVSSNPIKAASSTRHQGHVLVITDVSAARELEKLKLHFLSMVTHELKTPLTVVLGYTKVMLKGKGGELNPKHRQFVQVIDRQATQLKEMLQDLLDITRLEAGNLPTEPAPLEVGKFLEATALSHEAAAREAEVELGVGRVELDGAQVLVDRNRLSQVLGNLIGNAVKFTKAGGEVRISAGVDGDQVWIAVTDTGRGIPADSIPHLFDKFYQVEKGDTRRAGGAGLGLYICRELITAIGGTIEVNSKPGKGSRFVVHLPLLNPEK